MLGQRLLILSLAGVGFEPLLEARTSAQSAATWYPVNDHPSDVAAHTFKITVPRGLEAMANGVLKRREHHDGLTTWTWDAKEPMAPYLTTATIGQFELRSYVRDGIPFVDAIDPDLYTPTAAPRTGKRYAFSQQADSSYRRLTRTVRVPSGGARLSFWVARDTEQDYDFAFVEARTRGGAEWTTLPDLNGHTTQEAGFSCPAWLAIHPFLAHYQSEEADGSCTPTGSTGQWWAASGASEGYERWSVDLSRFAGRQAEVSISYASDDIYQFSGLFVDDIVVSTGAGTTSFEDDGNTLDGWRVAGPPAGSPGNPADWMIGTTAQAPSTGKLVQAALDRQPDFLKFLSRTFGPYPFSTAGGVVDDVDTYAALENQTRPVYGRGYFHDRANAEFVVLHELAHQWLGDDVYLKRWRHIWLNEGFATYANWLWDEDQGGPTAQESSEQWASIPADSAFWSVEIGNPGPDEDLLDIPVYYRGAMTLQALRRLVGDPTFFLILRRWTESQSGSPATTQEFIRLSERLSGRDLGAFFDTWLFTPSKPPELELAAARSTSAPDLALPATQPVKRMRSGLPRP